MADIFSVIADATRRDILRFLLERGEAGDDSTSVSHIVQHLEISQPTVSKHLKVLRDADLVSVREDGQHRFYSLTAAPLDEIDEWLLPFLDATDADIDAAVSSLPDTAVHAAEAMGRAAASVGFAVSNAFRRRNG